MTNNKNDSTTYFFITTPKDLKFDKNNRVIKDIKYRTLADAIYSKKGVQYSEDIYNRSKKALADLRNFSFIDIIFVEDSAKNDTLQKIGYLNSVYKLTRKKVHSFGYQLDVRTDKAGLSLSYGNKNIFKRADYLNINLFGSYFYYSKDYRYPEIGGSVSLDIPRLWIFRKYQKPDAIRYSTSLKIGANYSGLYKRWMFNTSYSYNWTPSYTVNHSVSPIDISTINTDEKKSILHIDLYPESYQLKFDKFFLLSFKYAFNYIVPIKKNTTKHNMRFSLFFESTGLLLGSLNKLISPNKVWNIGTYKYSTFENIEFLFRYNYNINENNSVATRFNVGMAYPIFSNSTIPYEKGYYVGGSNSMRAWSFRSLGPGSYNTNRHLEYTGDIKLEINVEYRGTIYKAFKYGVFVDMGNIWLAKKQADMPNANFSFDRFYKEIAIGAGVGLRLDFN
ncbi:MAG: BamA/TamA family outer membrane protein, partial [Bacteroidales bacterium]